MAGLVPAIHVFALGQKFVDARHKAGHDEEPVVGASLTYDDSACDSASML